MNMSTLTFSEMETRNKQMEGSWKRFHLESIRWEAHRACKNKIQVSESLKIYWPFTAKQTNLYQQRWHWLQITGSQDFSSCRCTTWENVHKEAAFFLGVLLWFIVKIIILCLWHCNHFYYNQVFCPKEDYCFCLESVQTFSSLENDLGNREQRRQRCENKTIYDQNYLFQEASEAL